MYVYMYLFYLFYILLAFTLSCAPFLNFYNFAIPCAILFGFRYSKSLWCIVLHIYTTYRLYMSKITPHFLRAHACGAKCKSLYLGLMIRWFLPLVPSIISVKSISLSARLFVRITLKTTLVMTKPSSVATQFVW